MCTILRTESLCNNTNTCYAPTMRHLANMHEPRPKSCRPCASRCAEMGGGEPRRDALAVDWVFGEDGPGSIEADEGPLTLDRR